MSICIPTRDGAAWIAAAIASVTSENLDLEVVVSDDASTDRTLEIASSTGDPRIRVHASKDRLGMARNWNRAVELSRGAFVKLLMQDDEVLPGSLSRQRALLEDYPTSGFAFGPRVLESDGTRAAEAWIERYQSPHLVLASARNLLPGARVLGKLVGGRLRANAIGEPSVVLIRRSTLDRTGLFNPCIQQLVDLDMWIRLASVSDVAFDPEPVARFRVHSASATARNRATGDAWLDRLRIVDGLYFNEDTRPLIGLTHYAVAIAAGFVEAGGANLRRRRSVARTCRDLRSFMEYRSLRGGCG